MSPFPRKENLSYDIHAGHTTWCDVKIDYYRSWKKKVLSIENLKIKELSRRLQVFEVTTAYTDLFYLKPGLPTTWPRLVVPGNYYRCRRWDIFVNSNNSMG